MLLFTLLIVYIPIFLIGLSLPLLSKKTLFFGVNIPEEKADSKSLRLLRNKYFLYYCISNAIASVLIAYGFNKTADDSFLISLSFIFVILLSANYYYIHLKAKKLKQEEGWIIDKKQVVIVDTQKRSNEMAISYWWFIIPVSILIFGVLFSMIQYLELPDKIPGHFNAAGEVTRYDNKSLFSVFSIPLVQLGLTALMFGLFKVLRVARITINPAKPKTSLLQGQLANRRWGIFTVLMAILLNLQLLYTQLMVLQLVDSSKSMLITMLLTGGIIVLVIITGFMTGQGGSRIRVKDEEQENPNLRLITRDDDRYWKLGMLYYNPDDPTLWVEKRFGIGWTINHGHPVGKVLTVIIIVLLGAALIFPMIK